jgi:hypothetical protein
LHKKRITGYERKAENSEFAAPENPIGFKIPSK